MNDFTIAVPYRFGVPTNILRSYNSVLVTIDTAYYMKLYFKLTINPYVVRLIDQEIVRYMLRETQ